MLTYDFDTYPNAMSQENVEDILAKIYFEIIFSRLYASTRDYWINKD